MTTITDIATVKTLEIPEKLKERNRKADDGLTLTTGYRIVVSFQSDELTEKETKLLSSIKNDKVRAKMEKAIKANRTEVRFSGVFNAEDILENSDGTPFVTPEGGLTDEQQDRLLEDIKKAWLEMNNQNIFTVITFTISELLGDIDEYEGITYLLYTDTNGITTKISDQSRLFFGFFEDIESAKSMIRKSLLTRIEDGVFEIPEKDMEDFRDKVAVVTGGAQGIGRCISEEFRKAGAQVCVIDKQEGDHFVGDIANKQTLEQFTQEVIAKHGHVDYLINNALPLMKGIDACSYEEFQYAMSVGVTAPFYLAKLFAPHFAEGAAIVNISSSRDRMSQPQTESYTAAKGGIAALTHALAVSLAGRVRVNSISPGWIDTAYTVYEGDRVSESRVMLASTLPSGRRLDRRSNPDAVQQPVGRVGNPLDIANMVLFLCSDKAGFITGENICIDGGMTHQMIYHGDNGWKLEL